MPVMELKSVNTSSKQVVINIAVQLHDGITLDQDMVLTQCPSGKWSATINLDNFPAKDTPEDAAERLSIWLYALSKGIRKSKVKKFNLKLLVSKLKF